MNGNSNLLEVIFMSRKVFSNPQFKSYVAKEFQKSVVSIAISKATSKEKRKQPGKLFSAQYFLRHSLTQLDDFWCAAK